MKIVSVGEITIDHYLDQEVSFVGGISLNFAVHAKRCGTDTVSLVSCVGTDEAGIRIFRPLTDEGVDASHVTILNGKTATCDIHVQNYAERSYPSGGYHLNVLADFQLSEADLAFIGQHDILVSMVDHSQSAVFFNRVSTDTAFAGKRVVDFGDWSDYRDGYNRLLSCADKLDIAFVSGSQATIDRLRPLSINVRGLIVVTLGAGGSVALHQGRLLSQGAIPVSNPVDSTGCGDAFQAAFTVHYFRTGDINEALYKGAVQAALVLQHYGAFSQIV